MRTDLRYTTVAISLHWLIAALIFGGWGLGFYMEDLPLSPSKLRYYSWHKWIGVSVFLLSLVRVVWLLTHPAPRLPQTMASWQRHSARLSHVLLYGLMLLIPLSGWLMSSAKGVPTVYFGLVPIPDLISKNKELGEVLEVVHQVLAYSLAVLIAIHIAAVAKHQWWDRDGLLGRMLPVHGSRGLHREGPRP